MHLQGRVLIVAWHAGIPSATWEVINARIRERLAAPRRPPVWWHASGAWPRKTGTLLGGVLKPVAAHHQPIVEELLAKLAL